MSSWIPIRRSPIFAGLLQEDATTNGIQMKWHFSRAQKLLLTLLLVSFVYLVYTLSLGPVYDDSIHSSQALSSQIHDDSFNPQFFQPPIVKQKLPEETPTQLNGLDSDDINPTMPAAIRKALVISSYKDQNKDWLQDLDKVSKGWEVYRYVIDDKDTSDIYLEGDLGREALAYLTFLVDHYEDLPDYTIFSHGHDRAWHQPMRFLDKMTALNYTALDEEHYINLRCTEAPGCSQDTKYYYDNPKEGDTRWGYHLEKFWNDRMRPQVGHMPKIIGRRCCAQFAVDRKAILHRPLIFYERLRDPLIAMNMTRINQLWGEEIPEIRIGTMYEMTWHIIFGKPPDYCPSRDYCNQVHFQDKIHCDREVEAYKGSAGWEEIMCTNDLVNQGG